MDIPIGANYPNEKDYTRTTRLESVILGLIGDAGSLRALKKNLIRSNTRGVYKGDADDREVAAHDTIQESSPSATGSSASTCFAPACPRRREINSEKK